MAGQIQARGIHSDPGVDLHLTRLIAQWDVLADSFLGELYLYVPVENSESGGCQEFECVEHLRPSNFTTLQPYDPVGVHVSYELLGETMKTGEVSEIELHVSGTERFIKIVVVPVRYEDEVVALLVAERLNQVDQNVAIYERFYRGIYQRLLQMVASGSFPYPSDFNASSGPRLADGLLRVDTGGYIKRATPNAVSALRRLGFDKPVEGSRLRDFGFNATTVARAVTAANVAVDEIQSIDGQYAIQVLPLVDENVTTEAVVMLRRRSKDEAQEYNQLAQDTTVREIHHRIKNNLQVVSSVLSLGRRRLKSPEAMDALTDSVRRISSIASVHELLSQRGLDDISSTEVIHTIVGHLNTSLLGQHTGVRIKLEGEGPIVQERVASALAMICSELVSNAIIHGFPKLNSSGEITVALAVAGDRVSLSVSHNGETLPKNFNTQRAKGLGMKICESLVAEALDGEFSIMNRPNCGVEALVSFEINHALEAGAA